MTRTPIKVPAATAVAALALLTAACGGATPSSPASGASASVDADRQAAGLSEQDSRDCVGVRIWNHTDEDAYIHISGMTPGDWDGSWDPYDAFEGKVVQKDLGGPVWECIDWDHFADDIAWTITFIPASEADMDGDGNVGGIDLMLSETQGHPRVELSRTGRESGGWSGWGLRSNGGRCEKETEPVVTNWRKIDVECLDRLSDFGINRAGDPGPEPHSFTTVISLW